MLTKTCFKCSKTMPASEFYAHHMMKDGILNKCKECTKADAKRHRMLHLEQVRERDRKRGARQTSEYRRSYRKANAEKYKATTVVGNAVRDKRLHKPSHCTVCGIAGVRIYGHHSDYTKPLDVIWCCQACHKKIHAEAPVSQTETDRCQRN